MGRSRVRFVPVGRDVVDREVYVASGTTVKDAISMADLDLDFPCGGMGKCGKCRIRVREGAFAPTGTEQKHLGGDEIARGFRLACLANIQGDTVIELPEAPGHKILAAGSEKNVRIDPHLVKTYLELEPPSLDDQTPDWERLRAGLRGAGRAVGEQVRCELLRDLPQALRRSSWRVTAVTGKDEVLGLEELDTTETMRGLAFDIGTTTVVGYLMDLHTGRELAVVSDLNPQTRYGADVVSRIAFASHQKEGLGKLNEAIVASLNRLTGEAAGQAGIAPEEIYTVSVVGNTCMQHLFLGINPRHLALAPYVPVIKQPAVLAAQELGLHINRAGQVYVLPNIAGYVGSDTVGVLLAAELDRSEEIKLIIDIGTNGEIALGSKKRMIACSAAAGPAFEGSQVSSGMRGAAGAIDHVHFEKGLKVSVIGETEPRGICGSGLLDAVAGLFEQGIIDYRGVIQPPDRLPAGAARYGGGILELENGMRAFLLVDAAKTAHGRPILITQKDIRELQMAKGAIAAGIGVLLERLGIGVDEIGEALLAGAFGSFLDPRSACAIGLIPQALAARVRPIGNAAGSGAKAALLSRGEYRRAGLIADSVEYVELSAYPKFNRLFTGSLYFPAGDRR